MNIDHFNTQRKVIYQRNDENATNHFVLFLICFVGCHTNDARSIEGAVAGFTGVVRLIQTVSQWKELMNFLQILYISHSYLQPEENLDF